MSVLIESISIPKEYRTTDTVSPTAIHIYNNHISVEGPRASSFFFRDFSGITMQKASILCAYASLILLTPVNANDTWKNDVPILTDANRILFCGGLFSYKGVNTYVASLLEKIKSAFNAYKISLENQPDSNTVEEIKQYKELLDLGAITQDEFDEKKKQLLSR